MTVLTSGGGGGGGGGMVGESPYESCLFPHCAEQAVIQNLKVCSASWVLSERMSRFCDRVTFKKFRVAR